MGEVYKARDTRLERSVAIKILPTTTSSSVDARARFEREARTLASLNHPHICSVYDVGQQDGTDFLVMELLEGQTLAARLERGPLPLDQALTVAGEIADALDKAHRRGITHRDLKPANVMLTGDGAKLLDFGLAKLTHDASAVIGVSTLPTNVGVTAEGSIVGTLQYMAPEQLEGREADARTDIFAYGSVLYEMVTGRRTFEGKSHATLISAIMSASPRPMRELVAVAPPSLERIVLRCLEKDPENRWQNARDLLLELQAVVQEPATAAVPTRAAARPSAGVAVVASLLAAIATYFMTSRSGAETPVWSTTPIRFTISPPADTTFFNGDYGIPFAVSPDGRQIVFVATPGSGARQLWLRPFDSDAARPESFHSWPQFLQDGRHFIYMETNPGRIHVGSLDGGAARELAQLQNISALGYASGYILYVEAAALYARPFDEERLEFTGEPIRIVDGVPMSGPGRAPFSVSSNGILAYSSNAIGDVAVLQWFDRSGRPGIVAAPPANYSGFSVAPDGRALVYSRWDAMGERDVWVSDLVRGGESRLTFDGDSMKPLWSPKGDRIVFGSARERPPNLFVSNLETGARDQEVTKTTDVDIPQSWSADGNSIVFHRSSAKGLDLHVVHLSDRKVESLPLNTTFNEWQGRVSPDGRWIAYVSDESGRNEVVVAAFPSGRGKRSVSIGGGTAPEWRGDSRELFYVSNTQQLVAVSITATASSVDVGTPVPLFRIERTADLAGRTDAGLYIADPSGQRFLIATRAPSWNAPPIQVIVNWTALFNQR